MAAFKYLTELENEAEALAKKTGKIQYIVSDVGRTGRLPHFRIIDEKEFERRGLSFSVYDTKTKTWRGPALIKRPTGKHGIPGIN